MRLNNYPVLFVTVLRNGKEYPLSPGLEWQPGEVDVIIVRGRNTHPSHTDAFGAVTVHANGHRFDPAVALGDGPLDESGRFVGPTQSQAGALPALVAGRDLAYNLRVPPWRYVELRVSITWGNTDNCPAVSVGPENPAAPAHRVAGATPSGITPLGWVTPTGTT